MMATLWEIFRGASQLSQTRVSRVGESMAREDAVPLYMVVSIWTNV